MKDYDFKKQIIRIIDIDKNFKNIFEKEFENLPCDLFNRVVDVSKELIKDFSRHNEEVINKMYSEYDIKNTTIYLTQEEYDDLNINNEINPNIVIGEKNQSLDTKELKKISIRKQVFALENMNLNFNNNLKELETMTKF